MKVTRSKSHVVIRITPGEVERFIKLVGPISPLTIPFTFIKGWRDILSVAHEILVLPQEGK